VKERDVFAEQGIRYAAPFVSLDEPKLAPKQLFEGLADVLPGLTAEETARAVDAAYRALRDPIARVEYLVRLEEGSDIKPKAPPEPQVAIACASAKVLPDPSRIAIRKVASKTSALPVTRAGLPIAAL